ncbi:unnamed protein product [Pedinophyceae sp. YPF-701]|nr:unnamed protein product [Pedinophyceae sp. YPF-701]
MWARAGFPAAQPVRTISVFAVLLFALLVAPSALAGSDKVSRFLSDLGDVQDDVPDVGKSECEKHSWRKRQLKLLKEMPFSGLFGDLKGHGKFEASGIERVHDQYYVVFDSLHSLGRVDNRFRFRSSNNVLLENEEDREDDSQYEAVVYRARTKRFILVQEAIEHDDNKYRPVLHEVEIDDKHETYKILEECSVDFEVNASNKGFEGMQYIEWDGHEWFLALCEGNHCEGGEKGMEKGNGKAVLLEFGDDYETCVMTVVKTVDLPATAFFTDYSAMAIQFDDPGPIKRVVVASQADSELWLGRIDLDKFEFVDEDSEVLHFPRTPEHCEVQYCNVEGVKWLGDRRLAVVSDKAKRTQSYLCTTKEEMLHAFALPEKTKIQPPARTTLGGGTGHAARWLILVGGLLGCLGATVWVVAKAGTSTWTPVASGDS